jgi:hypothetical protein
MYSILSKTKQGHTRIQITVLIANIFNDFIENTDLISQKKVFFLVESVFQRHFGKEIV